VVGYTGTDKCVIIPDSYNAGSGNARVVSVDPGAFRGNTVVEYVYMGSKSFTDVKSNAFRGCTSLREVTFGTSLSTIGQLAFADTSLRSISVPDSVRAIGLGALRNTKVEQVRLPFIGGSKLTSNPYLGFVFGASGYAGNEYYVPSTLKLVELGDYCTIIPAYSFYGCTSLEEIVIGSGVKEIGISAFSGCVALRELYIPASVKDIPSAANEYNSIVYGCSESLVITVEGSAAPEGYGKTWCVIAEGVLAKVEYTEN